MGKVRPTNAEILARRLKAIGVRYVFDIPSGQILATVEALEAYGIRFVLVSHEMSAAFMSDVVGRLTGVSGVALATLGPGATNLTTGVGDAFLDRSPCLIMTCQVPSGQFGRRVQMHVDHQQLFRPLTNRSTRRGACRADLLRHRGGLPHGAIGFAGDALVFRGGSPQVPAAGQRPPSVSADAADLAGGREPVGGARRCLRRDRTAEGWRDPAVVADPAALSRPEAPLRSRWRVRAGGGVSLGDPPPPAPVDTGAVPCRISG